MIKGSITWYNALGNRLGGNFGLEKILTADAARGLAAEDFGLDALQRLDQDVLQVFQRVLTHCLGMAKGHLDFPSELRSELFQVGITMLAVMNGWGTGVAGMMFSFTAGDT